MEATAEQLATSFGRTPNPNPNPNPNPYQVKDMLSLRMRLAYINSEAAKKAHSEHAQP